MMDLRITDAERRERAIYRAAMENDDKLVLNPPATKEEIAMFERSKAEMRKDEACHPSELTRLSNLKSRLSPILYALACTANSKGYDAAIPIYHRKFFLVHFLCLV